MIGLVDANNFYVSCERVFDARLRDRPVLVLSNNDGCAIARSNEAKALGVRMGQPIHEVPSEVRRQLIVRSANFALYGDLSGRVVSILRDLFPVVEVYSCDESFVDCRGLPDPEAAGREARARILQWVGIPCCVGLSGTKGLAKAANKMAKKTPGGVVRIDDPVEQLRDFPVEDVWGVGRRWAARLGADGILTAGQLMAADPETLRARYGVVLARTQRELQGIACQDLDTVEPDRKQIVVSRSFGSEVESADDLVQAVSTFATRACEKLRQRSLKASGVWVWMHTNPFRAGAPQYHPSRAVPLVQATADTREVLAMAQAMVRSMYRPGYRYKKAGIGLLDLAPADLHQGDLFSGVDPRAAKLMSVLDEANRRFGRGSMTFASAGRRQGREVPVWAMRQKNLSQAYTTRWDQLLKVR